MKKVLKVTTLAAVVALAAGCTEKTQPVTEEVKLETPEQKAAYAMGASLGNYADQTLKQQEEMGITIDRELLKKGFMDALGGQSKLNDDEIRSALQGHEERIRPIIEKKVQERLDEDRKKGEEFLKENAKKEGVKTTESGLQYEVIEAGEEGAAKPGPEDEVTVHYTGTLIDGTVFDSSVERGQPATFPLNGVIKGWQEGLQLMPVGSKYKLYIPSELAYGDQAAGTIPPASTLVFDVELLDIADDKKKEKAGNDKK
ncbi:FKBP-type peptidyl-prolyl cis-trans isomerase [Endozoicomonas sp. 4G]|uniref:FKBP-type peptidyl-prolyl cis-trans isomerase n=1 Tax=Endozoicomonas sp. 4G TaxID=2872754 RepID=UPI0020791AB9|nr:FKBP-type peptidyl-prolyl cis-trans isomerase [Endozoicomonas sp. 4G]